MLVANGAHPNGSPTCLSTPLYIAAMQGLAECVQILIKARADINCSLTKGPYISVANTPLHVSFAYRHRQCFRILLLGGADPNCGLTRKDLESRPSLLDAAIDWGDIYFVKLLVEFGGVMTKNSEHWKAEIARPQKKDSRQEMQSYLAHIKS